MLSKQMVKIQDIVDDGAIAIKDALDNSNVNTVAIDDAFFIQVAKHLPLGNGGEFDIGVSADWDQALESINPMTGGTKPIESIRPMMRAVIIHWWQYNASDDYYLQDGNKILTVAVEDDYCYIVEHDTGGYIDPIFLDHDIRVALLTLRNNKYKK